ncbi:DUF3102 domain-containing protein [Dehalobacter sp. MCB1]|uniref:DUF3102 domain-containing protein n=1 Tax=Dehalobacter sp. MCB1 TaxID=1844756 RepID=UPI001FAAB341|nr:DUF3102 domain-containing protein [Dehalobacter sp. MCB1]
MSDSNPDSNLSFSQAVILLGIPTEERENRDNMLSAYNELLKILVHCPKQSRHSAKRSLLRA